MHKFQAVDTVHAQIKTALYSNHPKKYQTQNSLLCGNKLKIWTWKISSLSTLKKISTLMHLLGVRITWNNALLYEKATKTSAQL